MFGILSWKRASPDRGSSFTAITKCAKYRAEKRKSSQCLSHAGLYHLPFHTYNITHKMQILPLILTNYININNPLKPHTSLLRTVDMLFHPNIFVNIYCNFSVNCRQHICSSYTHIKIQKAEAWSFLAYSLPRCKAVPSHAKRRHLGSISHAQKFLLHVAHKQLYN